MLDRDLADLYDIEIIYWFCRNEKGWGHSGFVDCKSGGGGVSIFIILNRCLYEAC